MTGGPRRTCVGCRRVLGRQALVRLVRNGGGVVAVDPHGTAAGRGAWVCPEESCLERALQRGRLTQAFRKACEARAGLVEEVRELWRQR